MKKLREERGYTLVIVLLLIVFFLALSTVFINTSLSHAKQEKTVDNNNHAVIAAEMGIERYSKEVQFQIREIYTALLDSATYKMQKIEKEALKFPGHTQVYLICESEKDVAKWVNCNIDKLENELTQQLKSSMVVYLDEVENAKKEIEVDDDLYYAVKKFEIDTTKVSGDEIYLTLHVVGKKVSSKEKLLISNLTLPKPKFFDPEAGSDVEIIVESKIENLNDFFPQLSEKVLVKCPVSPYKNMPPCEFQGGVSTEYLKKVKELGFDSTFYIRALNYPGDLNSFSGYGIPLYTLEGEISNQPNLNNATNIKLYYRGILDLKNTNVHTKNNFLMAEIITLHNGQNIFDNTLIVVGNKKESEFKAPAITINNGSKLCVNLDGITPIPSNLFTRISDNNYLSVTGTGMIYLYSSKNVGTSTSNVKYFNDPSQFLSTCGVSISYSISESVYFTIPGLTPFISDEMDLEVDYRP